MIDIFAWQTIAHMVNKSQERAIPSRQIRMESLALINECGKR